MLGGSLPYDVYTNRDKQKSLCEYYNDFFRGITKDDELNAHQTIAVGDSHGSPSQIFYPLIRSGLVENLAFDNFVLDFNLSNDIESCPTVVFLGDVFHKTKGFLPYIIMYNMLIIKEVIDAKCKALGIPSKFIILLGNHDLIQYAWETTDDKVEFNDYYKEYCDNEHKSGLLLKDWINIDCITKFVNAVKNGTIKAAYVDDNGNLYSHTVLNGNKINIDVFSGSEVVSRIYEMHHIRDKAITIDFNSEKTDSKPYNVDVANYYNDNLSQLIKGDKSILLANINFMWDRPATTVNYEKPVEISCIGVVDNVTKTDIGNKNKLHVVGHTQVYKRHPTNLNKTQHYYLKNKIINLTKIVRSKNKTKIEKNEIIANSVSDIRKILIKKTCVYENIVCCDSQTLTEMSDCKYVPRINDYNIEREDISDYEKTETINPAIERVSDYVNYIGFYKNVTFEQPTYHIISDTSIIPVLGPFMIVSSIYNVSQEPQEQ